MSNWFQEHPVHTIIGHTILVATTTWIISSFIIDENRINLYKAQAENAQGQINNEKTISEQYKAKVSVLEQQISRLRSENERYLAWLSQDSKSFPALTKKIADLESKLKETSAKVLLNLPKGIEKIDPLKTLEYKPYSLKETFQKGESFTDPETFATIGISRVSPDYTASGIINIPGKENIELKNIKPGEAWQYEKDGKNYRLTIDAINWIDNSVKASVQELNSSELKPNK